MLNDHHRCLKLREKCANTEFFLVRIFLYSVQIQENTDQKKTRICTLFTQCDTAIIIYLKPSETLSKKNFFGTICFYRVTYAQLSTELLIHICSKNQEFTVPGTQNSQKNSNEISMVDTCFQQSKRIKWTFNSYVTVLGRRG